MDRETEAETNAAGTAPDRLTKAAGTDPSARWDALLQRLSAHTADDDRFTARESIARGGMGEILEVTDVDLRRRLAMKVIRSDLIDPQTPDVRLLGRFLEEAQVTAQLDHPGIVPVHDVGLSRDRLPYFTMRLVDGDDLGAVFRKVHARLEDWSLTRALGVIQNVCYALAFAHERGVIHRDLKPANIMVGRFAETYVMDWGLARFMPESPAAAHAGTTEWARVDTDLRPPNEDQSELFATHEGDVLGTLGYMPPEQAAGDLEAVGPRSDVYAVGAILYELLTGAAPYFDLANSTRPPREALRRQALSGPPTPIHSLAKGTPPELIAICEKAMARAVNDRFESMADMAEDLRAYLENRVVSAHRTGPLVELRKWIDRNRGVASALAALVAVMIGAGFMVAVAEARRAAEVALNSDLHLAGELIATADQLGPIAPDTAARRDDWLARTAELATRRDEYGQQFDDLLASLEPPPAPSPDPGPATRELLARARYMKNVAERIPERLARLGADQDTTRTVLEREQEFFGRQSQWLLSQTTTWPHRTLADPALQLRYDRLRRINAALDRLLDPDHGLVRRIEREQQSCRELRQRSIEQRAAEWDRAIASIADPTRCPLYDGLTIEPQLGLIPLWRDSTTGLWEFWHVLSGARPERDPNAGSVLRMHADSAMVMVLVPPGNFLFGSQGGDPAQPNYDPDAHLSEGNVVEVELAPYFLSKFEMTQGQWIRATGTNPSEWFAGSGWMGSFTPTRVHPVERVTWEQADAALETWGLSLPTEAQFERALRAGSTTAFCFEAGSAGLPGRVRYFEDGAVHDAVDGRPPQNAFGFHDIVGNVWELCRDGYVNQLGSTTPRAGDGLLEPAEFRMRAARGGAFNCGPFDLRAARRVPVFADDADGTFGVRAARPLDGDRD